MIARLIALLYVLAYPECVVSVYDVNAGPLGEFIALHDFTQTWSTCAGLIPRRRLYGRDILVEVCACKAGAK